MSMLSAQSGKLRSWADQLSEREEEFGVVVRSLVADLREAADTIESLRDRLQEVGDQACHATQPNYEHCKYSTNRGWRDTSRYSELFGTPERAARTLETVAESLFSSAWSDDNATLSDVMCALVGKCDECVAQGLPGRGVSTKCGEVDYDALLEWLRGDAE